MALIGKNEEEIIAKHLAAEFAHLFETYESPFDRMRKKAAENGGLLTGKHVVEACKEVHGDK